MLYCSICSTQNHRRSKYKVPAQHYLRHKIKEQQDDGEELRSYFFQNLIRKRTLRDKTDENKSFCLLKGMPVSVI